MKISPINFNRQNFTSTTRTTYISNSDGVFTLPRFNSLIGESPSFKKEDNVKMVVSNSTNFFRKDISWNNLGKIFRKQFPKGNVKIYDFACSDGSEAYSIIIALMEQLGQKEAKRFLPIIASDVDEEIIRMANSGKIGVRADELPKIEDMIKKGGIEKYFIVHKTGSGYVLSPKEILSKNVVFKKETISKGLDEVNKDENNIIFCRNFWKYLSFNEMSEASWKLKEKLNDKTLVAIGDFDIDKFSNAPSFILNSGLRLYSECLSDNIYSYRKGLENIMVSRDKRSWDKLLQGYYRGYIPFYVNTSMI